MSAAIYIVPEKPLAGIDDFVNGKAVASVDEVELDELCKRLKVKSLWAFVSQDPGDFADLLEEGEALDLSDSLPDEQWFAAEDGLKTVRALQGHLGAEPPALFHEIRFRADLED
eukprot:gene9154-11243_t